ncbi:MAG: hypothetical protein ACREEP_05390, partial [Dongiaceae bacterium]
MKRIVMILLLAFGVAMVATAASVRADQRDPRLEDLFARLKGTDGLLEARAIEHDIWSIWLVSANPEVNRLMGEGVVAMNTFDFATAIVDFTRLIELDPEFAEGWNKRA